jgi:hypothetical protein
VYELTSMPYMTNFLCALNLSIVSFREQSIYNLIGQDDDAEAPEAEICNFRPHTSTGSSSSNHRGSTYHRRSSHSSSTKQASLSSFTAGNKSLYGQRRPSSASPERIRDGGGGGPKKSSSSSSSSSFCSATTSTPKQNRNYAWGESNSSNNSHYHHHRHPSQKNNESERVRVKVKAPIPHFSSFDDHHKVSPAALKIEECNFIKMNKDSIWKHDTIKGNLKERGKKLTQERPLGKIPKYIIERKLKAAKEEEEKKREEDARIRAEKKKLGRLISDSEKVKLMKNLKSKRQELERDFQRWTYTNNHGSKRLLYLKNLSEEMDSLDLMIAKLDAPCVFVTDEGFE